MGGWVRYLVGSKGAEEGLHLKVQLLEGGEGHTPNDGEEGEVDQGVVNFLEEDGAWGGWVGGWVRKRKKRRLE